MGGPGEDHRGRDDLLCPPPGRACAAGAGGGPSHLTVQWLVELFHKFNHLFTLMDTERYEQSLEEQPTLSPWARFNFVVTSLELLQRSEQYRQEAGRSAALGSGHHRRGPPPQGREGVRGRAGAGEELLGPAVADRHAHAARPRRVSGPAFPHRPPHRPLRPRIRGAPGSAGRALRGAAASSRARPPEVR